MLIYTLVRSKRKTVTLSVSKNIEVIIKAPLTMSKRDIDAIVTKHAAWIEKQTTVMRQRNENRKILNEDQTKEMIKNAKLLLPIKVEKFSAIMGVKPAGVKITSAKTRWGSCSANNILCFTYRLMLLPDELIDYVVVHELAHIKEKNHSAAFYAVVEKFMPDYKIKRKMLKASPPA
ncbi:MAG: M48 family metallopeptidase [Defluviitaleaceae bacterium]|nr:M48 family metallopeptidase [Defluviitaleaceae bacterium]